LAPTGQVYGVRRPYGVVVPADESQERVVFTEELERGVVRTMAEMRRMLENGEAPGPRWAPAKCHACGYRPVCWGDEDVGAAGEGSRSGRAEACMGAA
jgi:CRISPR/Cas system-associated exonuclease Cas4 (RecB family)